MVAQNVSLVLDTKQFDRDLRRVKGALGALVSIATVKTIADLSDRFNLVNARLKLVTRSTDQFRAAQDALRQVSSQTRSGLEETTDLFARLARSTADTAVSQEELLTATTAINQAIKVSGASSIEANAAIIQLGQGLASGALRGDELRSVLEQTPRLAQAIAAGLGVSIGELRKLGTEGKLSTQAVLDALVNQAPKIAQEFSQIPPTIADAFTALNNSVLESTKALEQAGFGAVLTGVAKGVEDSIRAIAESFQAVLPEKNLNDLITRVRIAMLDVTIAILEGVQGVQPVLDTLFGGVKQAINNLIRFFNQFPPEVQAIGLVGYFLVGRGVRLVLLAVAFLAKEIAKTLDAIIKPLADTMDWFIDKINKAKKILKPLGADQTMLEPFNYMGNEMEKAAENAGIMKSILDDSARPLKEMGDDANGAAKQIDGTTLAIAKLKGTRDQLAGGINLEIPVFSVTDDMLPPMTFEKPVIPDISTAFSKDLQKRYDALKTSLATETEAEMMQYQERLKLLEEFQRNYDGDIRDFNSMQEEIERQHQKKLSDIKKSQYDRQLGLLTSGKFAEMDLTQVAEDQKLKFVVEAGGAMLNEMGKHNKEAFYAAKAFNIGQAIMNTATGVTKALAQGGIFGPILAGIIIATGAAQIASIAAQQYTGRQFGGPVSAGKNYLVGERGPEMFVPSGSGQIVNNKQLMGSGAQPVNVTFNIDATDAEGFDELLMTRKPIIIGMVQEAMNRQGTSLA